MLSSGLWGYKESEQERQSSKVDILVGGGGRVEMGNKQKKTNKWMSSVSSCIEEK